MDQTIQELRSVINDFAAKFGSMSDAQFSERRAPGKWSRKEVLGHLIDSAHNNLRRFITGQYESNPPHIIYEQDFWVAANAYHTAAPADLVSLWKLMNERILAVLAQMPPQHYQKPCNTGRKDPDIHTIEWLAADYVKHLKHHINQIIPGSFNIVYP